MRILTAGMLSAACLLLVGCFASDLPYYISMKSTDEKGKATGPSDCVLPLDQVVKTVVETLPSDEFKADDSIRTLQRRFELALALSEVKMGISTEEPEQYDENLWKDLEELLSTRKCNTVISAKKTKMRQAWAALLKKFEPLKPRKPPAEFWVRQTASKWMATYSLDPADPNHSLDRFEEFLRSSHFVKVLAGKFDTDENKDKGNKENNEPNPLQADEDMSETEDIVERLYSKRLTDLINGIVLEREPSRRHQHRVILLGYQIPWDEDRTLIRYGVTFYFEDWFDPDKRRPLTKFIGYDLLYANEATPDHLPKIEQTNSTDATPLLTEAWYWTEYPFSAVIGIKEAAFEVIKMPFSLIAGLISGRDVWNYPVQNLLNARDALKVELLMRPRRGAAVGLYRLLTETPLVGQVFQYNWGADWSERDPLPSEPRRKLFLSRGIYGGNKWGQDTGLWAAFAKEVYPTYDIYSPPYRHGTVIDVAWSMFNLSHGPGYTEARYIMDHANPNDRLYLAG